MALYRTSQLTISDAAFPAFGSSILFDEPTEGLDALAEQHMIELIRSWKNHKTIILVTHKRSILTIADYHLAL